MALNSCNNVSQLTGGTLINSSISLTQYGSTLIYSNTPENIGGNQRTQVATADNGLYLYQDTSPGRTRVYYYHLNDTNSNLTYHVLLYNPNNFPVYIYLARTGSSASSNFVYAGSTAWSNWLSNAPYGIDTYQTTLGPGGTYMIQQLSVPVDNVGTGIVDFVATNTSTSAEAPITATVYAMQSYVNAPMQAALPDPYTQVLPNTGGDTGGDPCLDGRTVNYGDDCWENSVRGTFTYSSRFGTINWNSTSGAQYIELFSRHSDPRRISGEFLEGIDKNSGNVPVWSPYGFDFTFTINLVDGANQGTVYGYLQNPYGGGGSYYVISEDTTPATCGPRSTTEAWNFDTSVLNGGTRQLTLWTALAGGFWGRQQIWWA